MGNISSSSSGGDGRRRFSRRWSNSLPTAAPQPPPSSTTTHPPPPPATEITGNQIVFAAATPYPNPNPYHQYPGYYPPPPYDNHHHHHAYHHPPPPPPWNAGGTYPYGGPITPRIPYVEHQEADTIKNGVNLKKETLKLEHDPNHPSRFLVSFTFDATVSGRITVVFFAKESEECNLIATKEDILPPITIDFEKGPGQKFKQPSGSGFGFSVFEDNELYKAADTDIYPLAVKVEASCDDEEEKSGTKKNLQITKAVYENDEGEIKIRVVKQILYVNEKRYELEEIYGIGNIVVGDEDSADDANDQGEKCVVCLSEPRDTAVYPCRHMCLCKGCTKVLRLETNRCPICRRPVEKFMEIKVSGNRRSENNAGQGGTDI
ncbi:unnamed protein product [Cochlearia groenlandica]